MLLFSIAKHELLSITNCKINQQKSIWQPTKQENINYLLRYKETEIKTAFRYQY
jgi:hypothetical protein